MSLNQFPQRAVGAATPWGAAGQLPPTVEERVATLLSGTIDSILQPLAGLTVGPFLDWNARANGLALHTEGLVVSTGNGGSAAASMVIIVAVQRGVTITTILPPVIAAVAFGPDPTGTFDTAASWVASAHYSPEDIELATPGEPVDAPLSVFVLGGLNPGTAPSPIVTAQLRVARLVSSSFRPWGGFA